MRGRLGPLLIALFVALAAVVPVSARARAMMPAGMNGPGMHLHCPSCPDPARARPDKMPACHVWMCASATATLPGLALLPGRLLRHAAYHEAAPACWTAASRIPDPFPPRRIALA